MNASLSLLLIAAACLVLFSIKRIPEGQAYTIHRFGRYRRTLDAGVHWIMPLIERVGGRIALTGRALELAPMPIVTEGENCKVRGSVWFQVLDPARADADMEHLEDVVLAELLSALDRISERQQMPASALPQALKQEANGTLKSHGIVVTRCQLQLDALPQAA